jgi:hypothetical protein
VLRLFFDCFLRSQKRQNTRKTTTRDRRTARRTHTHSHPETPHAQSHWPSAISAQSKASSPLWEFALFPLFPGKEERENMHETLTPNSPAHATHSHSHPRTHAHTLTHAHTRTPIPARENGGSPCGGSGGCCGDGCDSEDGEHGKRYLREGSRLLQVARSSQN